MMGGYTDLELELQGRVGSPITNAAASPRRLGSSEQEAE